MTCVVTSEFKVSTCRRSLDSWWLTMTWEPKRTQHDQESEKFYHVNVSGWTQTNDKVIPHPSSWSLTVSAVCNWLHTWLRFFIFDIFLCSQETRRVVERSCCCIELRIVRNNQRILIIEKIKFFHFLTLFTWACIEHWTLNGHHQQLICIKFRKLCSVILIRVECCKEKHFIFIFHSNESRSKLSRKKKLKVFIFQQCTNFR